MELPLESTVAAFAEIQRVAGEVLARDKFLVALGGEHSISAPLVAAAAARHPGLSVLQIDAHADLRDTYMGSRHNHACAMRRVVEVAPLTQVGIRSLSQDEVEAARALPTRIFYDVSMRHDSDWVAQAVGNLSDTVYITIDCDGLDPAIMPAVGTPEPGGLSWREVLTLLRATFATRRVVACDVLEMAPIPGFHAPNFLCARLVYKLLTYRLGL
jgi:agmatinase